MEALILRKFAGGEIKRGTEGLGWVPGGEHHDKRSSLKCWLKVGSGCWQRDIAPDSFKNYRTAIVWFLKLTV